MRVAMAGSARSHPGSGCVAWDGAPVRGQRGPPSQELTPTAQRMVHGHTTIRGERGGALLCRLLIWPAQPVLTYPIEGNAVDPP